VLAIEDVHWADEATLTCFGSSSVGRPAAAGLVLTYRDDELAPTIRCGSCSAWHRGPGGCADCGWPGSPGRGAPPERRRDVDADEVFAVTAGNPYFVAEVLAAGDARAVPSTIADAVRARVARLDPATRTSSSGWPWFRRRCSAGWSRRSCRRVRPRSPRPSNAASSPSRRAG
jgi:hypothetical protein